MSNPRIMVTLTTPLVDFLDHVKHETGQGYAVTLRNLAIFSREFADFRKDQARQAAETAKASVKTTVVINKVDDPLRCSKHGTLLFPATGLCGECVGEEQAHKRRERERQEAAADPWPTPPEQENKEAFCHHGNQVSDSAGYQVFCFECSVEAGHEVCHEHREAKPCPYCSMDEIGEAAP